MTRTVDGYHHGSLREALVAAAAELVEAEGVDAVTLRELARRLGVSHAAPAHHFADRAALLGELAAEGFEELANELSAARTAKTAILQLRDVGRAYLRFALRRPGHYRVMFGRELASVAATPRLVETGQRAYQVLEVAVAAALPKGRRRPEHVADAAFLAWSATHGAAMLLLDGPPARHDPTGAATARRIDRLTASVAATISSGL